jgi:hypothetical protein
MEVFLVRRYLERNGHLRRWGAVYILTILFLGSWLGQAITMWDQGWNEFWAATFENWQSEWLQLIFQAVLLLGAKHWLFRIDAEDLERIEHKVDLLRPEPTPGVIDLGEVVPGQRMLIRGARYNVTEISMDLGGNLNIGLQIDLVYRGKRIYREGGR